MALLSFTSFSNPTNHFSNPYPSLPPFHRSELLFLHRRNLRFFLSASVTSGSRNLAPYTLAAEYPDRLKLPPDLLRQLAASAILFLGISVHSCSAVASTHIPHLAAAADCRTVVGQQRIQDDDDVGKSENAENLEDKEVKAAFEAWKSKTFALTVPLRIVALRSSIPPSWIKDFMQSQGRRVKLRPEFRGSLEDIFSDLSMPAIKGKVYPKSAMAADIVSVGDSWLNFAIAKALIEPIQGVEDQDWFRCLSDKWMVYLRRNSEGKLDSEGRIWAAPYRWGCMVISYKKNKFQKHNLAPIEDWADLWRPELAGKIAMVDSPREVVGAVLKYMGASYNTNNIDSEVAGGRNAVQQKLALLGKQVRLFDSVNYLKALGVGDVWVAVGWSSDVLPAAKRMSNVAVIVPKSGASLWADLWAIPAASRFATNQIGGRVRGPSPLVHQWIEFCLQAARALPFKQEVIPGASPSALESAQVEEPKELTKGKPKLDTNLIAGAPPAEILARCEFLEPLSDAALSDYQWLIASMQKPGYGLFYRVQHYIWSVVRTFWPKLQSKLS
uniref:Putrescine-binding periplasmic protein-related n=1 Tax=Davidia involucrata TaxID=16924 RepID=A0A5B7C2B1_DAVIN